MMPVPSVLLHWFYVVLWKKKNPCNLCGLCRDMDCYVQIKFFEWKCMLQWASVGMRSFGRSAVCLEAFQTGCYGIVHWSVSASLSGNWLWLLRSFQTSPLSIFGTFLKSLAIKMVQLLSLTSTKSVSDLCTFQQTWAEYLKEWVSVVPQTDSIFLT